ncbi:MAG: mannose-1-phosphate guanylyltransferase/mannose-6-phosphate isomerase [Nitrososphaeria archaeon]
MKTVILAGGKGTRLWPLSREDYPKQFLKVLDGKSLIQRSVDLYSKLSDVYVITSKQLYPFFSYEVTGLKQENVLQEPAPRGTAPAIAYALSVLDEDDYLFVPSDHMLDESFIDIVKKTKPEVNEIVLFGHRPEGPATGYGYIKVGEKIDSVKSKVSGFFEKPNSEEAERFYRSGEFLWNMGMFLIKKETAERAYRKHLPDVYEVVFDKRSKSYEDLHEVSFDKGIVEKYEKVSVVEFDGFWKDLGSWESFYEVMKKDANGNALYGDVYSMESQGSLGISDGRLTVVYGVKDLAVISTRDVTLVIPRSLSEKTKDIVKALNGRKEAKRSPIMYRSWGYYIILEEGSRYKVKKLYVAPGKALSYQLHFHRAEHWVVVRGTAKITYDGKEIIVPENESFFVPMGKKHRIENPGKIPLEIIEVQTGEYLEEDDIIRL